MGQPGFQFAACDYTDVCSCVYAFPLLYVIWLFEHIAVYMMNIYVASHFTVIDIDAVDILIFNSWCKT